MHVFLCLICFTYEWVTCQSQQAHCRISNSQKTSGQKSISYSSAVLIIIFTSITNINRDMELLEKIVRVISKWGHPWALVWQQIESVLKNLTRIFQIWLEFVKRTCIFLGWWGRTVSKLYNFGRKSIQTETIHFFKHSLYAVTLARIEPDRGEFWAETLPPSRPVLRIPWYRIGFDAHWAPILSWAETDGACEPSQPIWFEIVF